MIVMMVAGGKEQEEIEKELAMAEEYIPLTYAEYEEGLSRGKLLGLRCLSCGKITCHPMPVCQWCGSRTMERVELSGEGELLTFTVIRVAPEGFEAPYIPCLVRAIEGPILIGRLELAQGDKEASQALIGKRVKMSGTYTHEGDKFSGGAHLCPVFKIMER